MITLFADASWLDGAGGYAYWARCDGEEKVQFSAPWPCDNIDEAETVGLCAGMMAAIDTLPNARGVLIAQSDSLHALGILNAHGAIPAKNSDRRIKAWAYGGQRNKVGIKFAIRAMRLAREQQIKVYLKHVKAHTGFSEARSRLNSWCDVESRKARFLCWEQIRPRTPEEVEAAMRAAENAAIAGCLVKG